MFAERYLYDDLGRIVASFDSNNHPKNIYFYHTNNRVPDSFFRLDGSPSNTDDLQLGHAHHIVLDHLGSPKLVVDMVDNSVVEEINYDEFGNVTLDTNPGLQPFGFAGGLYDRDTKLVHFGARDYDASVGRWIQKDPIGFKGRDTNLYSYVLQDPVNKIDPRGTMAPAPVAACVLITVVVMGEVEFYCANNPPNGEPPSTGLPEDPPGTEDPLGPPSCGPQSRPPVMPPEISGP